MKKDKILTLAKELYKNEEVAIELANLIFGIRDGDYDDPEFTYPLYFRDATNGDIRKYTELNKCIIIWSNTRDDIGYNLSNTIAHTYEMFEPLAFNEERGLWDKAVVRCWDDDELCYEPIRFYDAINECVFSIGGSRNGAKFVNYEIVENPSKRMLEMQKTLED